MSSVKKNNKKVALGLSGGVDSAVCAHLLLEQGYDVTAVYIECWNEPGCRAEQDRADALKIALNLNIPFKVIDYKKQYKKKVMSYFLSEYKAGRTPNPDVLCNSVIKFGLFYEWAIEESNFDYIATGHYAKIAKVAQENNSDEKALQLLIAKDEHKDQTYFLHTIKSEQLNHVLFPLADLTKKQVREEAQKRKIIVAEKKDSVGICFVGDINVRSFLKKELGENHGDVVDKNGNIIGKHNGLWFYTIGQRQGFEVNTKLLKINSQLIKDRHNPPPLYVVGGNIEKNQLIVGTKKDTASNHLNVLHLHWINPSSCQDNFKQDTDLLVRIRHTGKLIPCKINQNSSKNNLAYSINLSESVEGIAEGQSAVIYKKVNDSHICLGGGVINK